MRKEIGDRPSAYILIGVALGILLMLSCLFAFSQQPQHNANIQTGQNQADAAADEQIDLELLWRKTTTDPVAAYTGVLAVLTFCLVGVAFFQGIMLIRSDKTARTSADTAKKAADIAEKAVIDADRPDLSSPTIQKCVVSRETFNDVRMISSVDLGVVYINVGKRPAIIRSIRPSIQKLRFNTPISAASTWFEDIWNLQVRINVYIIEAGGKSRVLDLIWRIQPNEITNDVAVVRFYDGVEYA